MEGVRCKKVIGVGKIIGSVGVWGKFYLKGVVVNEYDVIFVKGF